jgi:hypothetical protein
MTDDLQWLTSRPITDVTRYQATSYPQFRHGPDTATPALRAYTELPPGFNPRTLALAQELRSDPRFASDPAPDTARDATPALVNAALTRLRTGGYTYTLEPGVYGQHTADEFWFDRKEGFCEHIASAFVVLMRAMDVPARIVTGYQGGDRNTVDGYWTVRQSDAHAWAEVWMAGRGWVRVDPTSAVAPGRTGAFERLQAPRGALATAMGTVMSPGMAQNLRAMWEAVNNGWNQWVLNYTQSRQLDLLKALGFESPSWQDLVHRAGRAGGAGRAGRCRLDAVGAQPARPLAAPAGPRPPAPGQKRVDPARHPASPRHGRAGAGTIWRYRAGRGQLAAAAGATALCRATPRPTNSAPCAASSEPFPGPPPPRADEPTDMLKTVSTAILLIAACAIPISASAQKNQNSGKTQAAATARSTAANGSTVYATRPEALQFADDLAQRRDLDREWVRQAIGQARFLPQVPKLMLPPPKGTAKNWRVYRSRFIDPVRIRAGLRFWQDNADTLARAESEFGVPAKSSWASSAWKPSTVSRWATSG